MRVALNIPVALFIVVGACKPVDVTPVTAFLNTSVALGLGGSIAMSAIAAEGPGCVTMTPACSAPPCAARLEVAVSEACPLALGGATGGTVILDGTWTSADHGEFVPDLTQMVGLEDDAFSLALGAILVSRDADEVKVTFGTQGAGAGADGEVDANQQGWLVTAHLGGTPGDPTDDELEILGGGQGTFVSDATDSDATATARQLALTLTKTSADCRLNPVEGNATVSEVGNKSGEQTNLLFHAQCDGGADLVVSSADPTKVGSSVPLGFESD